MNDNLPAQSGQGPGWYPPPQHVPPPAAQPYLQGYSSTTLVRPTASAAHVAVAWVFTVFSLGYFLPWAIAATRGKSNALAIGLVNFLLGWTVLGWLVALVMACMSEPVHVTNVAYSSTPGLAVGPGQGPAAGWYPDGTGVRRYWDGTRWTAHTAP